MCARFIRGEGKAKRLRATDLRKLGVRRRLTKEVRRDE